MCSRDCPISVLFSSSDIIMSMSREQPLCREDSEELSKALAAGEWWAIVEVEIPISELPEFGDFTWCGPLEVEEAEAPVPTRTPLGSPVPKSQDWRNRHLSETVKPERQHPQEGPAAVESPQHAPVPTWFSPGSTDWRSQHPQQSKWMQKRVQKAPAAESSQQAPVPTGSPPKPPLPLAPRIPKGALVNSGTSQGSLVPSVSPKLGESLRIPKQPWQKQREQNIPKGASVSPFHLLILLIFRFITKKQKTLTSNMLLCLLGPLFKSCYILFKNFRKKCLDLVQQAALIKPA
ncbi:hypothetical protein F2P79_006279 [Pimephales promelas]|nr:hypothetical protein F2P79_006279 [Pimephales promelas]